MTPDEMIRLAHRPEKTPFDYVIVGSGAGGGPLAARLARGGRRVLLIDAGEDPISAGPATYPGASPGEVYACPGYHGAATEDREMSWQFSVRHYADDERQALDEKYNRADPPDRRFLDPIRRGETGRGGIFYPRSASLGGCTSHHAMIVVAPNDRDWDDIADLTGDESWRAGRMRGYFARLERCLYRDAYNRWLKRLFLIGWFYSIWQRFVLLFHPRAVLDEGGHGTKGWQPTSLIDPRLIETIQAKDKGFVRVLMGAALAVLHSDNRLVGWLKRALLWARIVQHIDFNDLNTRRTAPEGVFLIPTGIESDPKQRSGGLFGRRVGVREFVLETQREYPDRLVIATNTHVTRVLFADREHGPPHAIGVEAAKGPHLYEASPLWTRPPDERIQYFAKREVILCGGAFNTPQLLMLSGIGDANELAALEGATLRGIDGFLKTQHGLLRVIDLPGVGRNLQDRYEVSVISELDEEFATLKGASFRPGDADDKIRAEWIEEQSGLYGTNGGTLAVLLRSTALGPDDPEPDIFAFGVPAAFRGYYFGWSRELLRRTLGAPAEQRNLWSWVLLKAYTRNAAGTVTLRSNNPFDQPEICFDSFNEKAEAENKRLAEDSKRDLKALVDAIAFVRAINARNRKFVNEIQPGAQLANGSDALEEWIRTQAWGHHASCTCRIGSDPWQSDPAQLSDRGAVLDSRFRVHGVTGLRVVDASVFPKIPGYFILTPILMVAEKAADVLLAEPGDDVYAPAFAAKEDEAVRARRVKARYEPPPELPDDAKLPPGTVGLALSGGGIRSATFGLGVLQALAERNRLRGVDFLSTVSGGGFIGSFLGRLFTRKLVREAGDPVGRVQETLLEGRSAPLKWLRTQANYLFAGGSADFRHNVAIFLLYFFTVQLVVGALLFASFGTLIWLSDQLPPAWTERSIDVSGWSPSPDTSSDPPASGCCCPAPAEPCSVEAPDSSEDPKSLERWIRVSPWWWAPILALALGVLPALAAFWLSQKSGSYRLYPHRALLAWVVLVAGALWIMQTPSGFRYAGAALVILLLAWLWQDGARWGAAPARELRAAHKYLERLRRHAKATEEQEEVVRRKEAAVREQMGVIVRNRLTRALGEAIAIFSALAAFVALDTLALLFADRRPYAAIAAAMLALAAALPVLRYVGMGALRQLSGAVKGGSLIRVARTLGIPLAVLWLFAIDVLAHRLFVRFPQEAVWVLVLAGVFSFVLRGAYTFLNISSLRAAFGARLARTFLGASNAARVYTASSDDGQDVQTTHPRDDLPFDQYHPEEQGGPLHLINVCINETVDAASEREIRERKGVSMCVTPHGVTVGRRFFAEWTTPDELPRWQKLRRWLQGLDAEDAEKTRATALAALSTESDPNAFHVLKSKKSQSAEVEPLSLGAWTAISGAAFSTGTGRTTSLSLALFMGLLNVRLGYWWDSGIRRSERPGRYPLPLWRRIKRWPRNVFDMQGMLLAEFRGRFRGPAEWLWYLSDGGHFEVTGLYELIRRRVPFMIVTDAGEDPDYYFGDVAQLMQLARVDFGAQIEWVDSYEDGCTQGLPEWIQKWISPEAIGPIASIKRKSAHSAALARVTWEKGDDQAWILLLKPNLGGTLSEDIRNYAANNSEFPQQSTFDQAFDDNQWESYRALGQKIGMRALDGGRA